MTKVAVPEAVRCGHCQQSKSLEEFAPSQRQNGKWCRSCFRQEYRKQNPVLAPRSCEVCGTTMVAPPPKQRFCSTRCKNAARIAIDSAARIERKASRVCAVCGTSIASMRGNALWCSNSCASKARLLDGRVTPAKRRAAKWKAEYNLTTDQFDALLAGQNGRCAVCGTDRPNGHGWSIDHCHATGNVRGILCSPCNIGLGHLKDDPARLRAAAAYLERPVPTV